MTALRPRKTRGSGLVESTFALGAMLFVMIAAVEAGRYLYALQLLPHAAREGARWALVHPGGDVRRHVESLLVGVPARDIQIKTERKAGVIIVETEWLYSKGFPVRGRAVLPSNVQQVRPHRQARDSLEPIRIPQQLRAIAP